MMYPFHNLPIGVCRRPQDYNITSDLKKRLVAFKCLSARDNDLIMAYKYLFQEKAKH